MRTTTKPRGRGRNAPGGVGPGGVTYLKGGQPAPGGPPAPSTNGGTTAPGAGAGKGQGRGRGGSGQPPAPGGQRPGGKPQAPGVGNGGMAGPGGAQLARRVASGKITQEQADRTMKQRQTLQKAFGKDWRNKISGGGPSFAKVNAGLAKSPGDAKLVALRKKLTEGRQSALEAAKSKAAPKGKKKGKSDYPGESEE